MKSKLSIYLFTITQYAKKQTKFCEFFSHQEDYGLLTLYFTPLSDENGWKAVEGMKVRLRTIEGGSKKGHTRKRHCIIHGEVWNGLIAIEHMCKSVGSILDFGITGNGDRKSLQAATN